MLWWFASPDRHSTQSNLCLAGAALTPLTVVVAGGWMRTLWVTFTVFTHALNSGRALSELFDPGTYPPHNRGVTWLGACLEWSELVDDVSIKRWWWNWTDEQQRTITFHSEINLTVKPWNKWHCSWGYSHLLGPSPFCTDCLNMAPMGVTSPH